MNPTISDAGLDALTSPPTGFTLWYRDSAARTMAWEAVATCDTEAACLDAIATCGKRHGGWLILPAGQQP
jgi:hypothetical protein